jgi:hypothetical protein
MDRGEFCVNRPRSGRRRGAQTQCRRFVMRRLSFFTIRVRDPECFANLARNAAEENEKLRTEVLDGAQLKRCVGRFAFCAPVETLL